MAEEDRERLVAADLCREGEGEGKMEKKERELCDVDLGDDVVEVGCCEEGGGCCHSNNLRPLSVQSGDIVRPTAPSLPPSHGRMYRKLFPHVLKMARVVFFTENYAISSGVILCALVMTTVVLGYLVFAVYPLTYNISLESVQVPNHESSIHWDSYQAALSQQIFNETTPTSSGSSATSKDLLSNSDYGGGGGGGGGGGSEEKSVGSSSSSKGGACCYEGSQDYHQRTMHGVWILELVYRGRHGRNLLETDIIEYLHSIEEHIYNLPQYKTVCHFAFPNRVCDPINSILTYLYNRSTEDGSLERDNLTDNWKSEVESRTLSLEDAQKLLWYTGGNIGNTSLLRAQVRVGVPLPCYCSYDDRTSEQHQKVTDFFVSLIPFLDQASTSDIEVLYGGAEVFDYELNQAKLHDSKLAAFSLGIVLLTMFVLTGFSPSLTIWGGMAIVMCWITSLFVYRVVLGYETFSLLTIVTLFVVIGIGVDDIFVFMNTYKQSLGLEGLDSTHKRLTHTILVATSATFCTSATTAIAFFANAVSQIPAVRQFAIFTGLVIFFCFVTVAMTMPLVLHIWQCWVLPLEDFVFKLFFLPCSLWRSRTSYTILPPVRMTELRDELETDSGIIEDKNSDSTGSDSNSIGSDSHSSNSSVDGRSGMELRREENGTETVEPVTVIGEPVNGIRTLLSRVRDTPTIETRITTFLQKVLLLTVARGAMLPQMVQCGCVAAQPLRRLLLWSVRLIPVAVFLVILVSMGGALSQLRPTDHPPQFFDPDSNIQRMLDLQGNLTDREVVNCWDCSAWYQRAAGGGGGGTTGGGTTGGGTTGGGGGPTGGTTTSGTSSTPPTSSTATTSSHSSPTSPTTQPSTPSSETTNPLTPSTSSSSSPSTSSPSSGSTHSDGTPPTTTPTAPTQAVDPNLVNNVMVYVVFGVKGVKRKYSTSHVLPVKGEGRLAILDPTFSSIFTCPPPSASLPVLLSTLRAMCRICRNVSDPANGLVLNGTFTCFPPGLVEELVTCLPGAGLGDLPECKSVVEENSLVTAHFNYTKTKEGGVALRFLAMAFRSTTRPSGSATENIVQYEKWEELLSSEMDAIQRLSGPGQTYEGAWDIVRFTFQTSGYWVQINTEIIAIRGSFYGILISIILCGVVVAVLSNNWSVVLAMGLTILGILVTLLGLFRLFGWTLGIIEAVSLSILVGNSLDYCIHLSEGYMATDHRHLAFLAKFKFTHSANPRVKKVLSAISFIGVSILSSALTTFLATIPLLGAKILLFTRFAQILILDTAVAILYTLFFCATFLSLFGPVGAPKSVWRVLNAFLTITGTVVLMLVIFFVSTAIMSSYNII